MPKTTRRRRGEIMTTIEERLEQIETERQAQFETLWATQEKITELNKERDNLIMSREDWDYIEEE